MKINNYEIEFAQLVGIGRRELIASWHVAIRAYTVDDAIAQFDVSWKHWRTWEQGTSLWIRSIGPTTFEHIHRICHEAAPAGRGPALEGPECGPPLWRDYTLKTSPSDPLDGGNV